VCEGAKTEPYYFEGLKRAWRLSSANIHVQSPNASDPPSLVAYALQQLKTGEYDKAFCVFDRDSHAGFDQALNQVAQSEEGQAGRLKAIVSWPCFEIWVRLHFGFTAKAFTASGKHSACDNVIRDLHPHLKGYAKGEKTIFAALEDRLDVALANAARLAAHNAETGTDNPGTDMHDLIAYLKSLKPPA
jgi:hypothetical protein